MTPITKISPVGKGPKSTGRHTRAIARDRSKRPVSAPPAEAVVARLTDIVHRAKTNLAYTVETKIVSTTNVRDWRVTVGTGAQRQTLRLVHVRYRGK